MNDIKKARPFLKWAGGKRQLIPVLQKSLPQQLMQQENMTYVEPFVGAGAFLFWLLQHHPNITKAIINDLNPTLINTYKAVQKAPGQLIVRLLELEAAYHSLPTLLDKHDFYLEQRHRFNQRRLNDRRY